MASSNNRDGQRFPMGWRCAGCGELITSIECGWVEWLVEEDSSGNSKVKGLHLVHCFPSLYGPQHRSSCQYDLHREFQNGHLLVEGLPLARFVGIDGLMLLFSLLADEEMPRQEVLELAKRVQIPGYEQARSFFTQAMEQGVVPPAIADTYYLQVEIRDLLDWARNERG